METDNGKDDFVDFTRGQSMCSKKEEIRLEWQMLTDMVAM